MLDENLSKIDLMIEFIEKSGVLQKSLNFSGEIVSKKNTIKENLNMIICTFILKNSEKLVSINVYFEGLDWDDFNIRCIDIDFENNTTSITELWSIYGIGSNIVSLDYSDFLQKKLLEKK